MSTIALARSEQVWSENEKTSTHRFNRVQLIDTSGKPIQASNLDVGTNYIFHYPYESTPCFLINLGKATTSNPMLKTADGKHYQWQGGTGPDSSIVAFSAICTHKMTHPTRSVSFINYRHEAAKFKNNNKHSDTQPQVIYCCSEKSVYDANNGARVLGGPAKQPLASILLEYDKHHDSLFATGVNGGSMFKKFFNEYAFRLQLEHLTTEVERKAVSSSVVTPLEEYCSNQILC